MKEVNIKKLLLLTMAVCFIGTAACAGPRRAHIACKHPISYKYYNSKYWRHCSSAVNIRNVNKYIIVNRFTKNERMSLVIEYLKCNDYITVRTYSKITGLNRKTAELELRSFANAPDSQIVVLENCKNVLFTKR